MGVKPRLRTENAIFIFSCKFKFISAFLNWSNPCKLIVYKNRVGAGMLLHP